MSEYDEDLTDEPETPDEGMRGLRSAKKAAEERARQAEEQLAAAQSAQRELAAMKAGLDPEEKAHKFFLSHYDGDLSPEAVKAAAIDAGVLPEIAPEAQASVEGQAQMAQAFQGGEHTPLGSVQIGPGGRVSVPATEAEMWQKFEQKVAGGDFQGGQEVLRQYGHNLTGIESTEMLPGGGSPVTRPLS